MGELLLQRGVRKASQQLPPGAAEAVGFQDLAVVLLAKMGAISHSSIFARLRLSGGSALRMVQGVLNRNLWRSVVSKSYWLFPCKRTNMRTIRIRKTTASFPWIDFRELNGIQIWGFATYLGIFRLIFSSHLTEEGEKGLNVFLRSPKDSHFNWQGISTEAKFRLLSAVSWSTKTFD